MLSKGNPTQHKQLTLSRNRFSVSSFSKGCQQTDFLLLYLALVAHFDVYVFLPDIIMVVKCEFFDIILFRSRPQAYFSEFMRYHAALHKFTGLQVLIWRPPKTFLWFIGMFKFTPTNIKIL